MKRILVCGSTGLVGQALCKALLSRGYEVVTLDRSAGNNIPGIQKYFWDISGGHIDPEAAYNLDTIINLTGVNIAEKRWTQQQKKQILDSRIESTRLLLETCYKYSNRPATYISASALGYYGTFNSEDTLEEGMPAGTDFLAGVCAAWEKEAKRFASLGSRVVLMRKGVVLSGAGGAYQKFTAFLKWHINPQIGPGDNYLPWVHIDDVVHAYLLAIENSDMFGPYNLIAGEAVRMNEFCKLLADSLKKKPYTPPVPAWIVKIIFGELTQTLIKGSKASNKRIQQAGLDFKFPGIKEALSDLAGRPRKLSRDTYSISMREL